MARTVQQFPGRTDNINKHVTSINNLSLKEQLAQKPHVAFICIGNEYLPVVNNNHDVIKVGSGGMKRSVIGENPDCNEEIDVTTGGNCSMDI